MASETEKQQRSFSVDFESSRVATGTGDEKTKIKEVGRRKKSRKTSWTKVAIQPRIEDRRFSDTTTISNEIHGKQGLLSDRPNGIIIRGLGSVDQPVSPGSAGVFVSELGVNEVINSNGWQLVDRSKESLARKC